MTESSRYRTTSPGGLREALSDTYRTYYDTAFDLRDPDLKSRRAALMESGGGISQEPLVELLPEYVPSVRTLAEICDGVGLPELEPLLATGLLAGIEHPYAHQAEALEAHRRGRNVIVTSGTGSGKTESFLMPILAGLVEESRRWSAAGPADASPLWFERPDAAFEPQRKDLDARRPAIRALVLYPMNA